LTAGLRKLGYHVHPSHANFVLAKREGENLKGVYEDLKSKKILVRYFDVPGLQDSLRITVGTAREIQVLLEALQVSETNKHWSTNQEESKGEPL
jgi:histidinol-phosphate aminotransferase